MTGHADATVDLIDATIGAPTLASIARRYVDAIVVANRANAAVEAARIALLAAVERDR